MSVRPINSWSLREQSLFRDVTRDLCVVAHREGDKNVVQWAQFNGLAIDIGRDTEWAPTLTCGRRKERSEHFRRTLLEFPDMLRKVVRLRGRLLVCQCAPRPCHGDVLAAFANKPNEEFAGLLRGVEERLSLLRVHAAALRERGAQ